MDSQYNTNYFIDYWYKQFYVSQRIKKINKLAIYSIKKSLKNLFIYSDIYFERISTNHYNIFISLVDKNNESTERPIKFSLSLFEEIKVSKSINQKPINLNPDHALPSTEYFNFAQLEDTLSSNCCLLKVYANELCENAIDDLHYFSSLKFNDTKQIEIKIVDMITKQMYDFLNGITPPRGKVESPEVLNVSALLDEVEL
ncbi:hypothetical protein [Spartinivicinus ruber]|uniref:hypothetical protein n=1 Tax=Spartinivicinus ruber TaxID=2683272 RepID=UPI0013CF99B8|nr:hypothetical protein [Spartinivicinus ruber]